MLQQNKRWMIAVIGMATFMVTMSILAYLKLVPAEIKAIPFYDSIGHFMLFGILGFLAEMAFVGRKTKLFGIFLPLGGTLVALYAIFDECLQLFSSSRSFDLSDLLFGLLGIITFNCLNHFVNNRGQNKV